MRENIKKLFSLFLCLAMAIGLLPMAALAEGSAPEGTWTVISAGGTSYYKADGTAGKEATHDVAIEKTVAVASEKNTFDVTINVAYKPSKTSVTNSPAAMTLVLDMSNSMENDKADLLKQACSFLDSFACAGTPRYVSVVAFGTAVRTVSDWVDVSDKDNRNTLKGKINTLGLMGGTYTGGAMQTAATLFGSTTLTGISKRYCVLMTDGAPTYHAGATENSHLPNDVGNFTSEADLTDAQDACQALVHGGVELDVIAYALANATILVYENSNAQVARTVNISDWLKSSCGATNVYQPSDVGALTTAMGSITETITTSSTSVSGVTDYINAAGSNALSFVKVTSNNYL